MSVETLEKLLEWQSEINNDSQEGMKPPECIKCDYKKIIE
jgi:hypothetical protein